ncbi:MAG TPA: hypothetical protein VJ837_01295 [Candidatus Paceibacterota bacterium]|nr:hypothetical protein [Candidatus Paceibacterota bacterium]
MSIAPVLPVGAGSFLHDLEQLGAVALRVLASEDAEGLAELAKTYRFSERPERYGPRNVVQRFSACEEEDIPSDSPLRSISGALCRTIETMMTGAVCDSPFAMPLCFNDHLVLRYPPHDVGLGAHRDHSQYVNLIVSLTLCGESSFNVHDDAESPPRTTFRSSSGIAVFMRAPGFLGENVRPYHSVTDVSEERIALVLKQKGGVEK